jgi:type II secretory pathway pseudopilin PulG
MKSLVFARRMASLFFPDAAGWPDRAQAMRATAGRPPVRGGVTLIELMVALAITMIMMTAVITLFANVTTTVSNSRALIEISERLRTARNRLQLDLAGHTASTIPPLRPEDGEGYLEIIEGPNCDAGSYVVPGGTPLINQLGGVPNPLSGSPIQYVGSVLSTATQNDIMGDADDVLMLTVRSQGEPFVGWGYNGAGAVLTESNTAEVIWYAVPNGRSISTATGGAAQLFTLYRRVLLVAPQWVPSAQAFNTTTPTSISNFYNLYDVSVRSNSANNAVGNSLTDLTARENRFLHAFSVTAANGIAISSLSNWPNNFSPALFTANSFPYALQNPSYMVNSGTNPVLTSPLVAIPAMLRGTRVGEDVILTDVLAFDIRVFDPLAAVTTSGSVALVPSDPLYTLAATTAAGYGAFVDLGYNVVYNSFTGGTASSFFSAAPNAAYNATNATANFKNYIVNLPQTYDTWSWSYEQNGLDDDNNGTVDEGADGLDDDPSGTPNGIVDDPPQITVTQPTAVPALPAVAVTSPGERETLAPYPFPLRGVQITLRVYEPDTQQIRQMTVVQDFLPD